MPSGRDSKARMAEQSRVVLAEALRLQLGQSRLVALLPSTSLPFATIPIQYRPTPQLTCLITRAEQLIYLSSVLSYARAPRGPPEPT